MTCPAIAHLVDRADHVKRLLGDLVELPIDDHREPLDGVRKLNVRTGTVGEVFSNVFWFLLFSRSNLLFPLIPCSKESRKVQFV